MALDRYNRTVEVGDTVLAEPLASSKKHVVGTVTALYEDKGKVASLSVDSSVQVDVYDFVVRVCELIISKDGTLAHARTVIEVAV